ncbi:type VII secretion target [Actinoplanes missouriensis]|uniref:type VII secretion target n=1 Tax=Actinoplanes missouriensis TaxID=1866 RepID=UPI0033FECFA2
MQPGRLGVDVEALRGIGAEVRAAAGVLRDAVTAAGAGLAPPARPGSAASAAAHAAREAWLTELRLLTDETAAFGDGLTEAASGYETTDGDNAGDLRRGGHPVPR